MTKRDVGILVCRILAIFSLVQMLHYVPSFLALADPFFTSGPWSAADVFMLVTQALPFFLFNMMAVFLWRKAGLISAWMLGHDLYDNQFEPETQPMRIRADDLQTVAFSALGLWLLIDAIPRAAAYATQIIYTRSMTDTSVGGKVITMATSIDLAVRLILGLWLLFGARGLVGVVRTMRSTEAKNK